MKKHEDNIISANELAELLGIARNSVSGLANQEVLVRAKRGQYFEHASVTAYCTSLRSAAAGRGSPITAQRELLVKAQAQKAEDENRIRVGDMLSAAEVGARLRKEWNSVRAVLLGLSTRWQQRAPDLTNDQVSALDREIRTTLLGLGPQQTAKDEAHVAAA